jgi:hypothetical protein
MDAYSSLSRIDTTKLYKPFLEMIMNMLENLAKKGHRVVATSGYRSYEEQAKLYAQGRTAPGNIVTNAKPGTSGHNWGIALDFAYDLDPTTAKLEPSWKEKHLKIMADEADKIVGLDPGLYWSGFKDGPHVGLDLKMIGVKWADLLKVSPDGELKPAWDLLNGRFARTD